MAYDIGPKIGIEGEAEFRQAITGINTNLKTLGTEMTAVTSNFDKNEKSTESLTAKNKVLNKQIDEQKSKLSELEKGLAASAEKYGENDKVTQGWQQSVNKATADLNNMERELGQNTKAMDDLGDGMDKTEGKSSKFAETLKKSVVIGVEALAAATAAAGAAVLGLSIKTAEYADEIDKLSERTGINREELQRWKYAAEQSGADVGKLEVGIKKLSDVMVEASNGSDVNIAAFDKLGISMDDLKNKSQEDIFSKVMNALAEMPEGAERNALGNDLLGKSYTEMLPLLNAGADGMDALKNRADELGLVMSEDNVKANVVFGDTMADVQESISAAFRGISNDFLPVLQEMLDWVLEHMPDIKEKIDSAITFAKESFDKFGDAIQFVKDNMDIILPVLAGVTGAITAQLIINTVQKGYAAFKTITEGTTIAQGLLNVIMAANPFGLVAIAIGALVVAGVALYKNWDTVKEKAIEIKEKIVETFTTLVNTAKEWGKNLVDGLWNGMVGMKDWIVNKVMGFANDIANGFKNFFGIASPSKLMAEYGKNIDEGLAQGIDANQDKPLNVITTVGEKMASAAKSAATAAMNLLTIDKDSFTIGNIKYSNTKEDQKKYRNKKKEDMEENKEAIEAISNKQGVDYNVAYDMWKQNKLDKMLGNAPQYASGTNFHPGGLAWVGELGKELVDLPRGSKVYSNNESKSISNQRPINLYIGTYIGDDYGLKQLERKLRGVRIGENNRLGVTTG